MSQIDLSEIERLATNAQQHGENIGEPGWYEAGQGEIWLAEHNPEHEYLCALSPSVMLSVIADIRGLEAERDALRVDAERYRWLRDMSCSRDPEKQRLALDTLDRGEWWADKDAWIDAAMRESEAQS